MNQITRLIFIPILFITSISLGQDPPEATVVETTLSFWDLPLLHEAFVDAAPNERGDGIAVGYFAIDNDRRKAIIQLSKELSDSIHGQYDGLLISHKDELVFESYYRRGRIDLPHGQASVTKSYITLAIGRAIQLGYLSMADLHKPIVHFLKDLTLENLADGVKNISLHQALTMRSGIRVSSDMLEAITVNGVANTTPQFLQRTSAISPETQTFTYQGIDPRLAWQVLDSVVPGSAEDFMKHEVLAKIGITNYGWENDAEGSSMMARDMLKLGALVLHKGKWEDEQLISAPFLAKATSRITKPTEDWIPDTYFYGYFWYQADMKVGEQSYKVNFAWGGGGQYVITVAELDLIVVITGHDREDTIMEQVSKAILPAFAEDKSLPLQGPYLGQAPPGLVAEVFAPGVVSTGRYELFSAFTPDMKEFYFVRYDEEDKPSMIAYEWKDNRWDMSITGPRVGEPAISPDGKIMHLGRRYMERTDAGWSPVKEVEKPFKDFRIMRLVSSAKGTYYFDDATEEGPIRYTRMIDGKWETPKPLEVDLGKFNAHPFIAPDESYVIWDDQRESGFGKADIYISFRQSDGSWGPAINMGDQVNSEQSDSYATVTPDGKYILFNRMIDKDNVDIYWVDAQIIETLRPQ